MTMLVPCNPNSLFRRLMFFYCYFLLCCKILLYLPVQWLGGFLNALRRLGAAPIYLQVMGVLKHNFVSTIAQFYANRPLR